MPAGICLPPKITEKFKQALVAGKIVPEKLAQMTSEERHKLFSGIVGEGNAKFVNSTFEAKTLLKDQQRGYLTWAKKLTGVTPEIKRDLITRIGKLDHVLSPAEEKGFLKDLASTKLGIDVSAKEAAHISRLSSDLKELAAKQKPDGTFPSESTRMAYGRAKVEFGSHLADLKNNASKLSLKELPRESLLHPIKTASKVAGFQKSIKAAFDDSALLRQNWKTLLTHPLLWGKNARKNLADLKNQGIKGEDVMKEATADVISRPNGVNGYYKKMGIEPKVEEEFGDPTLITKIPGVGRLYKTTEVAFNALMLRTRADLADYYIGLAKKTGVELDDKQLKSIGNMIGGMTGRGHLGAFEKVANTTNNVFFSPRFVKSQLDTILHPFTGAGGSNFVRKQAAINLVKIVGATTAIFATANILKPGSVELDPRSSKFGKLKVGDTTFDLTGGFSSIAVLAARLYTQQYKSNKGIISTLGSNPMAPKGSDIVEQFITGKLSPAAQRVWVNAVTKQEFNGAKPTVGSNLTNMFEPLPSSTFREAKGDPHGANPIATEIADALGLSANTTNPATQVKQLGKADTALKAKIGDEKFQEFNNALNDKLTTFTQGSYYKNLSNDKKQSEYTYKEGIIKKNLYKKYGFTSPKPPNTKNQHKATAGASPN